MPGKLLRRRSMRTFASIKLVMACLTTSSRVVPPLTGQQQNNKWQYVLAATALQCSVVVDMLQHVGRIAGGLLHA